MRKLFLLALPLGLALVGGVMLMSHLQARDDAAELRAERLRIKREFDERAALLRTVPAEAVQEWRDELNVLLRSYFQSMSEVRNRYPRAPAAPSALEMAEAEKKGKLAEKDRATIEDFQKYADSRLAILSGGAYAPMTSVPAGGLRLDVLAVEPGASPAGGAGLRIDFALWGAPRLVERERSSSRTVSRTAVPLALRALQFRFLEAAGKLFGEMNGPGEPYQKLVDPDRFAPDFPPGVLLGTWWVELLPREAVSMEVKLDVDVRQPSGAVRPVSLALQLPVQEPWRIPPGTSYQAEVREASPAEAGK
jgi:hypothetical protein